MFGVYHLVGRSEVYTVFVCDGRYYFMDRPIKHKYCVEEVMGQDFFPVAMFSVEPLKTEHV